MEVQVDEEMTLSPTHHVDYYKNGVAIETEWNNKDPFFDRDLTTFRLLFDLNVLSVGVIITRADELQDIFNVLGKGASYGQSTTHMSKLTPKLHNRASGGCPVLAFGIKKAFMKKTVERADKNDGSMKFSTILADPPWQFANRTGKMAPEHRRLHRYETMKLDQICALPVPEVAADRSHIYLWVPNALLAEGTSSDESVGIYLQDQCCLV